jgi:hypothetical protein
VRIIVPFPAGQATDTIARLTGQSLSERLGQPFVIENRTGAGGNIGTESVVRATPDGYRLLLVGMSSAMNATLYTKLNFNFIREIAPVASIGGTPYVMVINASVPAKTVPEFIAYAKANPGKINMGSSGSGSVSHVFGERFKMMTGINLVHVPYRGGYVPDLLSGQVQVVFGTISSNVRYIRGGMLRALAVTTATRSDVLPDSSALVALTCCRKRLMRYAMRYGASTRRWSLKQLGCWMEACVARVTIRNAGEFNGFLKPKVRLFSEPLCFVAGELVLPAGYSPTIDADMLAAHEVACERFAPITARSATQPA